MPFTFWRQRAPCTLRSPSKVTRPPAPTEMFSKKRSAWGSASVSSPTRYAAWTAAASPEKFVMEACPAAVAAMASSHVRTRSSAETAAMIAFSPASVGGGRNDGFHCASVVTASPNSSAIKCAPVPSQAQTYLTLPLSFRYSRTGHQLAST